MRFFRLFIIAVVVLAAIFGIFELVRTSILRDKGGIVLHFGSMEPNMKAKELSTSDALDIFMLDNFFEPNPLLDKVVDSLYANLQPDERVGQMIVSILGNKKRKPEEVAQLIRERKVGGVTLQNPWDEMPNIIMSLRDEVEKAGSFPLILSVDAEPTLLNARLEGISDIPNTNEFNSIQECVETAGNIAYMLQGLGIHQNFAPVCDITDMPSKYHGEEVQEEDMETSLAAEEPIGPDISPSPTHHRSFGANLKHVAKMVQAFTEETQSQGIIATAKHFPGHGKAIGDSHDGPAIINGRMEELGTFRHAIGSGVISVMVGHIMVKDNPEYETGDIPASISPTIVTDLLKKELGFKGLTITDAMDMKAVNGIPNAPFAAIKAGNDMVLMPEDELELVSRVIEETEKDKEFADQIEESVKKIIRLKVCLGLFSEGADAFHLARK